MIEVLDRGTTFGFSSKNLGRRIFAGCSHTWEHPTKATTLLLWVEVGRKEAVMMSESVIIYWSNFYSSLVVEGIKAENWPS